MCDCLEKVKNKVAEEFNVFEVRVEGVTTIRERIDFLPIINIFYKAKKKNGEMTQREHKTYAIASFCPFCGKKYKE